MFKMIWQPQQHDHHDNQHHQSARKGWWWLGGWVPFPPSTFLLAHTPDIHDDHLADDEEQEMVEAKKKLNPLPAVIFCCLHPLLASGGNIFSPPWARTRCCNLPRQELATQLRLKSCQILFAKNAQCTSTATYIRTFYTYFCHQSAISALKAHKFIIVEYYYDFHCCVCRSRS